MHIFSFTERCILRAAVLGHVAPQLSHELVVRLLSKEGRIQGHSQKNQQYSGFLGSGCCSDVYEPRTYRRLLLGYRHFYYSCRSECRISLRLPDQSYRSQPELCWHDDVHHQLHRDHYSHYRATYCGYYRHR